MEIPLQCKRCGSGLLAGADHCPRCLHPTPPSIVDQMQLAVVERLAATAKWALVATVPPVLVSALLDLPDSLGRLTLLALQGFVLLYFNGRVAAAQRRRAPPGPVGPGSWLDPRFNQDLLAVGVSTVIALAGYLLLLRALLSLQ